MTTRTQVQEFAPPTRSAGHMTAAVLYGAEDLKIERVDIPEVGGRRHPRSRQGGAHLRHRSESLEAGLPRAHDQAARGFRARARGNRRAQGSAVNGRVRTGMRVVPSNSAPCNVCMFCRKGQPNLCEDLLFNNGAYAEYIRIPGRIVRENMLEIPDHVSFPRCRYGRAAGLRSARHRRNESPRRRHRRRDRLRAHRFEVHPHALRARSQRDRHRQAPGPDPRRRAHGRPHGYRHHAGGRSGQPRCAN